MTPLFLFLAKSVQKTWHWLSPFPHSPLAPCHPQLLCIHPWAILVEQRWWEDGEVLGKGARQRQEYRDRVANVNTSWSGQDSVQFCFLASERIQLVHMTIIKLDVHRVHRVRLSNCSVFPSMILACVVVQMTCTWSSTRQHWFKWGLRLQAKGKNGVL